MPDPSHKIHGVHGAVQRGHRLVVRSTQPSGIPIQLSCTPVQQRLQAVPDNLHA
jgi:hypothetical protein